MPPCRSARSRTQRMEASSSTSQTLRGLTGVCNMEWQQDSKDGLAGPAREFDQAVVTTHQVLRHCQTKSSTVCSPRHERIKQRVAQVLGHARAVVLELYAGNQPMTAGADVHIGTRARAQYQAAAAPMVPGCVPDLRQRLQRVATQVEHGLDDEIAIQMQWR